MNIKRRLTAIGLICSLMVLIFGGRSPTTVYADAIEHTHIWATKYDDKNHWEYCTVCGEIQNKKPHTFVSNGQSMLHCTNHNNKAYKKLCKCGYQSKPFFIIHGRYENWKDSRTLNYYGADEDKLDDIMQISKDEFEANKSSFESYGCTSQTGVTWTDDDGDGYGWVFCGGIVLKSPGVKGTIESIVGSEGDCGRKASFDENFTLVRYVNSTNSPTRMGFVEYLKKKINSTGYPTRHLLYGYDNKYQNNVTDEQFAKLVKEFSGYSLHAACWGWDSMSIVKQGHAVDNNQVYATYQSIFNLNCYDSSNDHYKSTSDGIKTDCDICDAHWTGNEDYESEHWYQCDILRHLKEGETVRCSGHKIYGREYMGVIYDTFTKKDGEYYRTKLEAVPASGYTAEFISYYENQKIDRTTKPYGQAWSYYGSVVFSNGTTSRKATCGVILPVIDETPPTVEAVNQKSQASSNGWTTINKLDLSGTENYCDDISMSLKKKSNNQIILDNVAIKVQNNKWTYTCTPSLEGSVEGTDYTITVRDKYGNVSSKDFKVYSTDNVSPQVESPLSYTDWTNTAKTITLTFTDYGSGNVQASLGDQTHYQACTKTADGKYQITYTFSDDITGTKIYPLYLKDALGNATDTKLTIGNIDKNTYSISYNLNGGSLSSQKTSYTVADSFTLPTPTKTGYTFTGWTGSNGITAQKTVTVNKGTRVNLSYTANWSANQYLVTFNGNGGSLNIMDESITKNNNGTATAKVRYDANNYCILGIILTRQGYTFKGFYDAPSGGIQVFKPYDTANCLSVASKYYNENYMWKHTGNVTLYAQWTPITWTVKYDANGGTGTMADTKHTYGASIKTTANAFTKTGYSFAYWNVSRVRDGKTEWLYANADNSWINGGLWYEKDKAPSNLKLYNWPNTEQSNSTTYIDGDVITLHAQWTINTYTNWIAHWTWGYKNQEGNNGNKTAFQLDTTTFQSQYGSEFTMDSAKAVKAPNGFYLLSFGTTEIDGVWKDYLIGTKVIQKNCQMGFQYDYYPYDYSITYNLNGGTNNSANPSTYNVLYGVTLKAPTKAGYTFTGWYDENGNKITGINEGCNAKFSSVDDLYAKLAKRTTGNRVLTAKWSANTYEHNLGAILTGFKNQEGTNTRKDCYIFKNIKFTKIYGEKYTLTNIQSQITMPNGCIAKAYGTPDQAGTWMAYSLDHVFTQGTNSDYFELYCDPISYTITYNLNGGTNNSANPSTYNVLYGVSLKAPTKAGYTFTGWYDENGNKITGINEGCNAKFSSVDDLYAKLAKRTTGNRVLTAHWSYSPVSVKVPQILTGDHTGKSQFRVKCDDFKAGNIKISVPNSFLYKQTGKADITATITSKSGNNTITPTNKVCIYDITANGLSAGCWQGSFNIGLTLTKE